MNRPTLTRAQASVLAFVKKFARKNGYSPTRREISEHFGWAGPNAAQCHLDLIAAKGYIEHRGRTRGIRLLDKR